MGSKNDQLVRVLCGLAKFVFPRHAKHVHAWRYAPSGRRFQIPGHHIVAEPQDLAFKRLLVDALALDVVHSQRHLGFAAGLVARALEDLMSYQERRTLTLNQIAETSDASLAETLRDRWYRHQRQREQALRIDIEHLYQHQRIRRQEAELQWHNQHDLFSEDTRKHWAVSKRYLATAGFGAGAVSGAGIDAVTFGSSLGTGALLGGLIGAAGSYFYGDRLVLPALSIGPMKDGLKTASFGPVQDSQFGYVVLGRAVDHWWHISQRNHAGRDLLELEPADHHWLEQLDKASRREIQRAFERCRKQRPLTHQQREQFAAAIEHAMSAYDDWRLNRA